MPTNMKVFNAVYRHYGVNPDNEIELKAFSDKNIIPGIRDQILDFLLAAESPEFLWEDELKHLPPLLEIPRREYTQSQWDREIGYGEMPKEYGVLNIECSSR